VYQVYFKLWTRPYCQGLSWPRNSTRWLL